MSVGLMLFIRFGIPIVILFAVGCWLDQRHHHPLIGEPHPGLEKDAHGSMSEVTKINTSTAKRTLTNVGKGNDTAGDALPPPELARKAERR